MLNPLFTGLSRFGFFNFRESFNESPDFYSLATFACVELFAEFFETGSFRDLLFRFPSSSPSLDFE